MNEKYIEVYRILSGIDKLSMEELEQLVSLYGNKIVSFVIENLVSENEENFYRFEVFYSCKFNEFDTFEDLDDYNLYISDVSMISCLDDTKNLVLLKQINVIIRELEDIFLLLDCTDDVLVDGKKLWIQDKINYCLKNCDDSLCIK